MSKKLRENLEAAGEKKDREKRKIRKKGRGKSCNFSLDKG